MSTSHPGRLSRRRWGLLCALSLLLPGAGHAAMGWTQRAWFWLGLYFAIDLLLLLSGPLWIVLLVANVLAMRAMATFDLIRHYRVSSPRAAEIASDVRGAALRPAHAMAMVIALMAVNVVVNQGVRRYLHETFRVVSGSMEPTLRDGDRVAVSKLDILLGKPEHGMMVAFEHPEEAGVIFLKRIVALAGDSVEMRCGGLFINGTEVPQTLIEGPDTCSYLEAEPSWDSALPPMRKRRRCSRYREQLGTRDYELYYSEERPAADPESTSRFVLLRNDFPRVEGAQARVDTTGDGGDMRACMPQQAYTVPAGHLFVLGDNRDNSSDSRRWGPVPLGLIKGQVRSVWWATMPGGDSPDWSRIATSVE